MEECCKAFGVVAVPLCRNAWHTIGSNHDAAAANGAAAFASAMANVFLCTRDVAEHVRRLFLHADTCTLQQTSKRGATSNSSRVDIGSKRHMYDLYEYDQLLLQEFEISSTHASRA
eukprot:13589-Heterococcus_DN1.PRE.1